jgi:hypothetical protein
VFLVLKLYLVTVNANLDLPAGQFIYDVSQPPVREAVHCDVNFLSCFPQFGNVKLFEIFPGREMFAVARTAGRPNLGIIRLTRVEIIRSENATQMRPAE